jgi:membrane associated rhomboid family serine protease
MSTTSQRSVKPRSSMVIPASFLIVLLAPSQPSTTGPVNVCVSPPMRACTRTGAAPTGLRYLVFYFAATMTQTAMTLWFGTAQDARVPSLGAIAAVLGAYFILYSGSRVTTWIFPIFVVRIPAWIWLGLWFLYQLIEGSFGLFNAKANGGGVAFFAHVGGFIFGALVTRLLVRAGQATPQARYAGSPLP